MIFSLSDLIAIKLVRRPKVLSQQISIDDLATSTLESFVWAALTKLSNVMNLSPCSNVLLNKTGVIILPQTHQIPNSQANLLTHTSWLEKKPYKLFCWIRYAHRFKFHRFFHFAAPISRFKNSVLLKRTVLCLLWAVSFCCRFDKIGFLL